MNRPGKLSHFDGSGRAHMVDVGDKPETHRVARAGGTIRLASPTLKLILAGDAKKGDVLGDRKSTRLNSSHLVISYAVFCLKKKAERCRYRDQFFMVPPWPEIFRNDAERRHSFDEAAETYETFLQAYASFAYSAAIGAKAYV